MLKQNAITKIICHSYDGKRKRIIAPKAIRRKICGLEILAKNGTTIFNVIAVYAVDGVMTISAGLLCRVIGYPKRAE